MKHAHHNPLFRKSPLAVMLAAALLPGAACALELKESPPGTQSSYVAPNVIISIDDSGSMGWYLHNNNRAPYTSSRMYFLKESLKEVFNDKTLLPDGKIRLAWQSINGRGMPSSLSMTGRNAMRVLDATHRGKFLADVNALYANGGTPLHNMVRNADVFMRANTSVNGPWAAVPGKTGEPYLGCRRNYHILLTDGVWGGSQHNPTPSNYDGTNWTLPDGKEYKTNDPYTQIYRDTQGSTIADWTFKSWALPLQPLSAFHKGQGPTVDAAYKNAPEKEIIARMEVPKYWNPKYNPASWPHMVTFTIGYSKYALPTGINTSTMSPWDYDGGNMWAYFSGHRKWNALNMDSRGHDMLHAAINGRGQFHAVESGADLANAFREIVKSISVDVEPARSAFAMSSTNVRRFPAGVYISGYDPQEAWRGWISGHIMNPGGGQVPNPAWNGKTTADRLDAMAFSDRKVWSWNANDGSGIEFKFDRLDAGQRKYFLDVQPTPPGRALKPEEKQLISDRIDYIKGQKSKEGTGVGKFRPRHSRQGDIVNSNIWYVDAPAGDFPFAGYSQFYAAQKDRQPMIYVGGNDGMLHGFSATDGREKIAYVPNGVLPTLRELTKHDYDDHHRAYVDGPVMTGDVDMVTGAGTTRDWRTVLVGALGAGGKGYYVLDVTNPNSFGAGNVLLDRTMPAGANSGDIGHIFAEPVLDEGNTRKTTQIARLNNNRWAAIMGNGYNSENSRPVLLIQYLDGARELKTLVAADAVTGEENGLAAPTLVDLNGDGKPDVVYAGDNMGNMWKFMIADGNDSSWGVAFGGRPLFDARSGNPHVGDHPITAAPAVRRTSEVNGLMLAFGTGRNITTTDANDMTVQSVYAVADRTYYSLQDAHVKVCDNRSQPGCAHMPDGLSAEAGGHQRADLVKQTLREDISHSGLTYRKLEKALVDYAHKNGWYMDLTQREHDGDGERLLKGITFGGSSQTLDILTEIPAKGASGGGSSAHHESCEGVSPQSQRQFLTRMNLAQPTKPLHTTWPEDAVELGSGLWARVEDVDSQGNPIISWKKIGDGSGGTATGGGDELPPIPDDPRPARPAWWQLQ